MSRIIVLQGYPASGKSTWAKDYADKHPNTVIVCRDSIREATGKNWVPSRENYISEIEEFQVMAAIKNNLEEIIDATNLNLKTIEKWKTLAEKFKVKIDFKPFYVDFKTALELDSSRTGQVGRKTLESFYLRYFPSALKEYYTDDRLKTQHPEKNDKVKCIIVDLDGTIALYNGRTPYDLSKVSEDLPNEDLLEILKVLNQKYYIFFVSGREGTEQCFFDTRRWLNKNFIDLSQDYKGMGWDLFMRKEGDFRKDSIIKEEIYHNCIEDRFYPIAVFDDRNQTTDMWRNLGLLCNQVYYGDF